MCVRGVLDVAFEEASCVGVLEFHLVLVEFESVCVGLMLETDGMTISLVVDCS